MNLISYKCSVISLFACLLVFIAKISIASVAVSEGLWDEVKSKEGITIFVGKGQKDAIVMVKTRIVIDAGIERVKAVLDDEERHVEWVPYLNESRILQTYSSTETLHYNKFDAPWPAANRDFVYHMAVVDNDGSSISYVMKSEESLLMPKQKRTVRALLMESSYTLVALNNNQTQVELMFHADPKGWLPLWIVNLIQRGFPFMVLKGLREQVSSGE